jgi:hypothetical protein
MPYTASIDRSHPGCILFLVDQSRSMSRPLAGQPGQSKKDAAADAVNRVVDNIAQRCSQGMEVREYFNIGIFGYGFAREMSYEEVIASDYIYTISDNEERTGYTKEAKYYDPRVDGPIHAETIISAFPQTAPEWPFLSMREVIAATHLEERLVKEQDSNGGIVEVTRQVPVWLRPHAGMETPMCEALYYAAQCVGQWIDQHRNSFPPIIVNISDGEASDGDPEPLAREIMSLRTSDGQALLFNCHLSEVTATPIQYPDRENALSDRHARQMFRMSSVMPEGARAHASSLGIPVNAESRCCVFNADIVSLVQFLDIGTRGSVGLR